MENITYKGYLITLDYEDCPSNPLDWATPEERGAWFVLKHNRYNLPFEADTLDLDDYNSWQELATAATAPGGEFEGKPYKFVRWFEHSGIAVSLRDDEGGHDWDAGIAGVIFGDTTQQIEYAFTDWKMYIEGDIYRFDITSPYGDRVESLGDVFGYEGAISEAKDMIDMMIKYARPTDHAVSAWELHR